MSLSDEVSVKTPSDCHCHWQKSQTYSPSCTYFASKERPIAFSRLFLAPYDDSVYLSKMLGGARSSPVGVACFFVSAVVSECN